MRLASVAHVERTNSVTREEGKGTEERTLEIINAMYVPHVLIKMQIHLRRIAHQSSSNLLLGSAMTISIIMLFINGRATVTKLTLSDNALKNHFATSKQTRILFILNVMLQASKNIHYKRSLMLL